MCVCIKTKFVLNHSITFTCIINYYYYFYLRYNNRGKREKERTTYVAHWMKTNRFSIKFGVERPPVQIVRPSPSGYESRNNSLNSDCNVTGFVDRETEPPTRKTDVYNILYFYDRVFEKYNIYNYKTIPCLYELHAIV